jgi:hypothetical protein
MAELLTAQVDYLLFAYGLVLVLLAAVSFTMSREGPLPVPWWLLAAFALTLGAAHWLRMADPVLSASGAADVARVALSGAAFAFLLEFDRRCQRAIVGTGPGRPVTGSFGVSQLADGEDLTSFVRRADEVLYLAKPSGRNRVRCAEDHRALSAGPGHFPRRAASESVPDRALDADACAAAP